MFRHPISFLAGVAVGALAMRYLESSGNPGGGQLAGATRTGGRLADMGEDQGASMKPDAGDVQVHERVRSRLGRLVRHPRLVHVEVREGVVWLAGHALRDEVESLVAELGRVDGVQQVREGLQVHENEEEMANLPAQSGPSPKREDSAEGLLH